MNKKVVILVIISIVIICGVGLIVYNKTNNSQQKKKPNVTKNKKVKTKCIPFTGGGFNIKFYTDGGVEIPDMHVCIACSPDSYQDLPIPVKEGSTFDGWYYDKEYTKKIEITNTRDFRAVPEYDKNKCKIGYKDIEIYAKWSEAQPRIE